MKVIYFDYFMRRQGAGSAHVRSAVLSPEKSSASCSTHYPKKNMQTPRKFR